MNKLAILTAAALTAGTFGLAAIAQDTTVGDFEKYDGNKDGVISWEEARGAYPTLSQILFDQADANGDGTLDPGEFTGLKGLTAGDDSNGTSSSEASSSDDSSSEASSEDSSSEDSSSEDSSSEDSSSSSAL